MVKWVKFYYPVFINLQAMGHFMSKQTCQILLTPLMKSGEGQITPGVRLADLLRDRRRERLELGGQRDPKAF